ncbi:unnamed protein product [Didymodactylos carnosus]|uniref:EGF-like domain-containing protein n=1 Tax=Didymodactylos carnosus TaxID=1234261 RepID=A0A814P2P2_9BILA|nr:unnamed protein product [Didymodactylos carnosus]CAF3865362.1 unnamed protein product [Didymodactylos carnosus]
MESTGFYRLNSKIESAGLLPLQLHIKPAGKRAVICQVNNGPCDTHATCSYSSTTHSVTCTCTAGFTGNGLNGNCKVNYIFGKQPAINISLTPPHAFVDAVPVNVSGIVTAVAFYTTNSCNDSNIQFGSFDFTSNTSTIVNLKLSKQSGPLSVNLQSSGYTTPTLYNITLCNDPVQNNPPGCQGVAFPITTGQYFGSYATQCQMGYTAMGTYPGTYYELTDNPFNTSAQYAYTIANANTLLQYITVNSGCLYA